MPPFQLDWHSFKWLKHCIVKYQLHFLHEQALFHVVVVCSVPDEVVKDTLLVKHSATGVGGREHLVVIEESVVAAKAGESFEKTWFLLNFGIEVDWFYIERVFFNRCQITQILRRPVRQYLM